MAKLVCDQCGEENEIGTEFCVYCHAFLAWDDAERDGSTEQRRTAESTRQPSTRPARSEQQIETRVMPRIEDPAKSDPRPPEQPPVEVGQSVDATAGRFRVEAEQASVTVSATGEPVELAVQVTNTSMIVDGYLVEIPDAPAWLIMDATTQVQLLPGTDGSLTARLRVVSDRLVPAQQRQLVLRILSMAQAPAHLDLPLVVTVPVVDAPVRLSAEPRLLRVRDRDAAEFTVVVDNSSSNRAVRLGFAGSDPELAVRFRFEPQLLEVGPGASGSVLVGVSAPGPEPGAEISRSLTVASLDGPRRVETLVTFQQSTTARTEDPPVTLEVEPSLVRVRDSGVGMARLTADNRGGTEWAHLQLRGSDPERLVRVTWSAPLLHVPPGKMAQADVRFEAPLPEAGAEVSRTVTLSAVNGQRTSTTTATFVQVASASPMSTLALRLEPTVVRVQDADNATVSVVVDNRRGRSGVRAHLDGTDPERAVRFTFSPQVVDVGPGQVRTVALRLDAWRPQPGQESTRQLTVSASDGQASVNTSGSLVQASSRSAIELLTLRLDPSVLRLPNRRRGRVRAVIDNRAGTQALQVAMSGDDPENSMRFRFTPPALTVPAGQWASANVAISAPRAPSGREVTRPFLIAVSNGQSEVRAEGSVIQSAAPLRPWVRALFTLLGGFAMIIGSFFFPVSNDVGEPASQMTVDLIARAVFEFEGNLGLLGLERVISLGLLIAALGVLVMFGLTGRSGRLSRWSALFAVVLVAAFFITVALFEATVLDLGSGTFLILVGCVLGYIGGLLARR